MRGDRLVQRAIEDRNDRLKVRAFSTRPQADARQVALRRGLHEPIHPQVHPQPLKGSLYLGDKARLTGAWSAVENDDLPWFGKRLHKHALFLLSSLSLI
jgi:hypothetical protein